MSLVLQGLLFTVFVSMAALLHGNCALAGTSHDWCGQLGHPMTCVVIREMICSVV